MSRSAAHSLVVFIFDEFATIRSSVAPLLAVSALTVKITGCAGRRGRFGRVETVGIHSA